MHTIHVPALVPTSRRGRAIAARAERRRRNEARSRKVVPGVIVEITRKTDDRSYRLFVTAVRPVRAGFLVAYGYEVNGRGWPVGDRDDREEMLTVGTKYHVRTPLPGRWGVALAFVAEVLRGRAGRHRRPMMALVGPRDTVTVHSDLAGERAAARKAWEAAIGRPMGSVEYPLTDAEYDMPDPDVDLNTLDGDEPGRDDN